MTTTADGSKKGKIQYRAREQAVGCVMRRLLTRAVLYFALFASYRGAFQIGRK